MQLELRNHRRSAKRRPFLETTPLIDAVFNLLIFFAVTMTVASSSAGMKVTLPKAKTTIQQNGNIVISLSRDGRIEINDNEVTWDQMHKRLVEAGADSPATAVIVRADKGVIYDSVVRVLDEVKGAGLDNLSLAVIKEKAG
ncbi:MAG: biopolymer transporter ExbD [bacterium]|nr:biopolymer transporter ExbD [bacterium]